MRFVIASFVLLTASASFASVSSLNGLTCTVNGSDLVNANDLSNRYVGTATPVTVTAIMKEDEVDGAGTYMTYVKINLTYNPQLKSPVALTTVSSFSDVVSTEFKGPLTAELKINSRVNRSPMILNVECLATTFDYLLNPEFDQQQDPLVATQNAAFTVSKLLTDLTSGVYYHSPTESESEFMAAHFCSEGDAQKLFSDIKANRSYATMWRTAALGDHTLSPQNLRLEGSTVRWEQPQETAVCIRSHIEDSVDDDGLPYSVEVCDEYRVDQLDPLALQIVPCELK